MKRIITLATLATLLVAPTFADNETEEFASDEKLEEGFVTSYINNAIANSMGEASAADDVEYGRKVTRYASAPKFGGYFIGKYDYNDTEGSKTNGGFSQRLVRFYVDGTLLNDFAYRIQLQANNASFHMKDFFLEWKKYDEVKVKIGQFKRAFTFENPMNPWDVGAGDYSQGVKKLAGMGDICGEAASNGGRDQGIQVQGDLFPVSQDQHKLIHYQLMVANGQGINTADADKKKDIIGTIQVQPVKGLFVGVFGWKGYYTANNVTSKRNRYAISAKYDANDWTARAEYMHHSDGIDHGRRADAWYATVGIPCAPWLKTYVKWDVFRDDANSERANSIYSIAPNFQLHKNLMFQVQYNYVNNKQTVNEPAGDRTINNNHNELWLQTYVRF